MKRIPVLAVLVGTLLLGGCGIWPRSPDSGGGQDTPAAESATASAPEDDDETAVAEEPLPVGHCGPAPAPLDDQMVYQGTSATDCAEAMDALAALARGEDDDSAHVSGHGTNVLGWTCLFPRDDEIAIFDLDLVCEKGPQRFVLRPGELEVPAGYHVLPWDYDGTATGAAGQYFTTESRKHHCSFTEAELGCDNHNFPDGLPEVTYMGQNQQPTAIVLREQGRPRFEAFGDPTFTQYSDSGEWGADTKVLAYGDLLVVRGIACTTDEKRGVVCTNGTHGFEISSQSYVIR